MVRDDRRPPFCWLANDAVRVVGQLPAKERLIAMAVYTGLAYEASIRRDGEHDGFEASRGEIAQLLGCTKRTVDKYAAILEAAGLLLVEKRFSGGTNLPNIWILTQPGDGALGSPVSSGTPGVVSSGTPGVVSSDGTLTTEEEPQEELQEQTPPPLFEDPLAPAPSQQNGHARVESPQIDEVWGHYRQVMNHPRREPTPKQRKVIAVAIREVGVEGCRAAIDSCRASAWHMGGNPQQVKYNEIDRILKTKLDWFLINAPRGNGELKLSEGTIAHLRDAIETYAQTGAEKPRALRASDRLMEAGVFSDIQIDRAAERVDFIP